MIVRRLLSLTGINWRFAASIISKAKHFHYLVQLVRSYVALDRQEALEFIWDINVILYSSKKPGNQSRFTVPSLKD